MRWALLALVLISGSSLARAEPSVDYLYIRANEGGSSGGHAAIRFGEWTFDFQHADGLLAMRRQDSGRFQYVYRMLENRGITLSRIEVTEDTYARLRSTFQQRFLVQERLDGIGKQVAEDVRVLEALGAGQQGGLPLEGVGFFFAEGATVPLEPVARAPAGSEPALRALRDRIEADRGPDSLARRREEALAALAKLRTAPMDVGALAPDPRRWPLVEATFSRRYENALSALFALAELEALHPLRDDALAHAMPGDVGPALDPGEVARLREAAAALTGDLTRLSASARPDWGGAMLLGMARLCALDASIARGRLVLLDAYSTAAQTLPLTSRRRALLPALTREAEAQLDGARARFLAGSGWDEASFRELEEAGNHWIELRAAGARAGSSGRRGLRVEPGPLWPHAAARVEGLPAPGDPTPLAERLAAARTSAVRYRAAMERVFGYDLLRRNCVTEIFRTLEIALAGSDRAPDDDLARFVRDESARRLGGYVHPTASGNFVPFVSSARVRARYAVREREDLPGFREQQVAEMEVREGRLRVALRESNVVTATAYRPDEQDGFFLFFTEDAGPLRPLLGALNLVAALGRSAVGLLALPLDGGRGLRAGLEGAFWSLPELAFQSVRKGTNEWVPPALRPPPG